MTDQPPQPPEPEYLRHVRAMEEMRRQMAVAAAAGGAAGFRNFNAGLLEGLPPEVRGILEKMAPSGLLPNTRFVSAQRSTGGVGGDLDTDSHGMPPRKIAIDPDDHHAEFIGRTADGRQFFLTTPFEFARDASGTGGNEFVALYLFDAEGSLVEARIEVFGPRATMDSGRRRAVHDAWLAGLGEVSIERIEIAPFAVERFGTTFGLIPREPDFDAVEVMPGNYMAFFAPWDSGEYDT